MPEIQRDPDTGAKLFKKSREEKRLDLCLKKISLLERKIESLEKRLDELISDDMK